MNRDFITFITVVTEVIKDLEDYKIRDLSFYFDYPSLKYVAIIKFENFTKIGVSLSELDVINVENFTKIGVSLSELDVINVDYYELRQHINYLIRSELWKQHLEKESRK